MRSTRPLHIYLFAALISVLLSLWYIHLNPVVNRDGVLYLLAAQGDVASARSLGNWIFYSKVIHWAMQITGLSADSAALLVNLLLDLTLVLAFLRLLQEQGASSRALAIGAMAILVLPYLNDQRAEVIRDHGYWAFSMLAMIFYLKLLKGFLWRWLVAWYLCMGIATLFRVEGAAFVALMPLGLLLSQGTTRQRLLSTLKAYLPLALVTLALLPFLHGKLADNRLMTVVQHAGTLLADTFIHTIDRKATIVAKNLSPYYAHSAAVFVVLLAVVIDILRDLGTALSWPFFFIFFLRNWFPAPGLPTTYRRALVPYVVISLLVLTFQELKSFIMVSRYTTALALMLLPVVVFALDALWQRYREKKLSPLLAKAVLLSVIYLAADSIIEKPGNKGYMLKEGQWTTTHTPAKARLLTDHETRRLNYYGNGRKPGGRSVTLYESGKTRVQNYDYAFVKDPNGPLAKALSAAGASKVETISRGKGRQVAIYEIKRE